MVIDMHRGWNLITTITQHAPNKGVCLASLHLDRVSIITPIGQFQKMALACISSIGNWSCLSHLFFAPSMYWHIFLRCCHGLFYIYTLKVDICHACHKLHRHLLHDRLKSKTQGVKMRGAPEHDLPRHGHCPNGIEIATEQWEMDLSLTICAQFLAARREPISYFATNLSLYIHIYI